ncbi:MAG: PAS domain S-box protein [Candidatus Nitronauta litoralis]|uniref:PAS domain S-box protein n=1 Tax=Candidatus Nitronauta litoralis TaxID=2705533 RepID=A0A7T0G129_9BACT|nr:MAG: PAS domain S-box protein [Candidatus Nitronauta litoralis]
MTSRKDPKASAQSFQKALKEIEYLNNLILNSAGEGIYGLDAEGKTTFVNRAAEKMTGYTAEEMIGKCQHELCHHSHPDGTPFPVETCPIYAAFTEGKKYEVSDEVFWRKDGTPFPVEYVSTPILENMKLLGAVVVFRDITERKRAEEEIQNLRQRLEMENEYLREEFQETTSYGDILGNSPALAHIITQIEMVAPTDASVLITGESGTGKELVAREIHNRSSRKNGPIIKVNCASIPRELYESEFFGHVKGSFTGALRDRAGRFELAHGGTLFLDEVGEIPLDLQSKLLRVLQEGVYERVGDEKTREVDVRLIAATNRDLKTSVREKQFREDLYFRLNVFPVEVPPLRDRKDDLPILAESFLESVAGKMNRPVPRLTRAHVVKLKQYDWPGNVRELQNVIERAVILSRNGKLNLDLPAPVSRAEREKESFPIDKNNESNPEIFTAEKFKELERQNICRALEHCKGKVSGPGGAAEILHMNPTTLASKMKVLSIRKPE